MTSLKFPNNSVFCLLISVFPILGCALNPVTRRYETRLISEAAERSIGEETKKQLIEEYGIVSDEVVNTYIAEIGRKVAKVSDRPRLDYTFTILDTSMVNAFAAPGGYIFVTKGLLEELSDEAELVSVLGHEIGHVAGYHPVKMIQKQMGYGFVTAVGAVAAGATLGPEAMEMILRSAALFTELYLLGYSRNMELEADRLGLKYAYASSYDPEGAVTFFKRLAELEESEKEDAGKWDQFFRSHPPTKDRIRQAKRYVEHFPETTVLSNTDEYQKIMLRLAADGPVFPGNIEGQRYTNTTMGITLVLPDGWHFDNVGQVKLVTFSRHDRKAFGELRYQIIKSTDIVTAKDFARDLSKKLRFENINEKVDGKIVSYPAGEAFLGHYAARSSLGRMVEARGLFVLRGDKGLALMCYSPPEGYMDILLEFEMIMRALRW